MAVDLRMLAGGGSPIARIKGDVYCPEGTCCVLARQLARDVRP